MKKSPFVAARLRLRRDADIIKALEEIEAGDVSCLVREGLRRVLNIAKHTEAKLQHEVKLVEQPAESEVVFRQIDCWSGKNFDRPEYQAMKRIIRQGDTVYLDALDRLGRTMTT